MASVETRAMLAFTTTLTTTGLAREMERKARMAARRLKLLLVNH